MTNLETIKIALQPIYLEAFGVTGFDGLDISLADDHAGEASVFVRANIHAEAQQSFDLQKQRDFDREVRHIVSSIEPDKFCYLRFRYDDYADVLSDDYKQRRKRRA